MAKGPSPFKIHSGEVLCALKSQLHVVTRFATSATTDSSITLQKGQEEGHGGWNFGGAEMGQSQGEAGTAVPLLRVMTGY